MKEYKYVVDLLDDGYVYRRNVNDMRLYRKGTEVMVAKVKKDGELEVLIHSVLVLGKDGYKRKK
jgi:hypothetical protein